MSVLPRAAESFCATFHSTRSSAFHGGSEGVGRSFANASPISPSRRLAAIGTRLTRVAWRSTVPSAPTSAYSDSAGTVAPAASVKRRDRLVGQHRDLAARHVDGGQPRARRGVERRAARNRERRRGDVDADLVVAVGQVAHRERVVDLGGGRVVDRERAHRRRAAAPAAAPACPAAETRGRAETPRPGSGCSGSRATTESRRIRRAARRDSSAARRTPPSAPSTRASSCRACRAASAASRPARRAAGARTARRSRRRSAPPRAACARPTRAPPSARRAAPCGSAPCRACRSTSAPRAARTRSPRPRPAAARGRSIRGRGRRSRTRRRRRPPTGSRVELGGELLRVGEQRRRRRLGEAQQHRRGLDLQALARGGLDLQRRIVVGEDRAGLAVAVVLEKDVHGMNRRARQRAPLGARL